VSAPDALYALFMALALLLAFAVRRRLPPDPLLLALPRGHRRALALAAFTGGVLGAKVPFALGGAWLHDGKTILAGIAGGYLAVELAKAALGITVKTGDSFALPLAVACAVGRWGCFFHGCCAGTPTALPWGCDFGDGQPRHPTQLYESLFHLAMAWALHVLARRGLLERQRLKLYLIAYCACRFGLEVIRPEPRLALGLTAYQWGAAAIAAALALQWARDRRYPPDSALRAISRSMPTKTQRWTG
jgi:phosphatidylglycerol:prolipoprotein diacylglycerol transferase